MSEYADRDTIAMSDVYGKHVSAMTAEGLHAKSDIAAELAHRDICIADLKRQLAEATEAVTALSKGKPLGPVVGAQTIINQQAHIKKIEAQLAEAKEKLKRTCAAEGIEDPGCPMLDGG